MYTQVQPSRNLKPQQEAMLFSCPTCGNEIRSAPIGGDDDLFAFFYDPDEYARGHGVAENVLCRVGCCYSCKTGFRYEEVFVPILLTTAQVYRMVGINGFEGAGRGPGLETVGMGDFWVRAQVRHSGLRFTGLGISFETAPRVCPDGASTMAFDKVPALDEQTLNTLEIIKSDAGRLRTTTEEFALTNRPVFKQFHPLDYLSEEALESSEPRRKVLSSFLRDHAYNSIEPNFPFDRQSQGLRREMKLALHCSDADDPRWQEWRQSRPTESELLGYLGATVPTVVDEAVLCNTAQPAFEMPVEELKRWAAVQLSDTAFPCTGYGSTVNFLREQTMVNALLCICAGNCGIATKPDFEQWLCEEADADRLHRESIEENEKFSDAQVLNAANEIIYEVGEPKKQRLVVQQKVDAKFPNYSIANRVVAKIEALIGTRESSGARRACCSEMGWGCSCSHWDE